MGATTRSCVACKKRQSVEGLVRLSVNQSHQIVFSRTEGRGAWVCLKDTCIDRIMAHPQRTARALRCKGIQLNTLKAGIREHLWQQCAALIRTCHRAGLVVGGTQRIAKFNPKDQRTAIIIASNTSVTTVKHFQQTLPYSGLIHAPASAQQLGALIGRGTRCALLVQFAKPSQALIDKLQHLAALR